MIGWIRDITFERERERERLISTTTNLDHEK